MPTNQMEIEIHLAKEDWIKFNKFVQRKRQKALKGFMGGFYSSWVFGLVLAVLLVILYRNMNDWHWPTALMVIALFSAMIGLFLWYMHRLQTALMPSEQGTFIGKHHFVFDENGIHSEGEGYNGFHNWKVIKSIERGDGIIVFFLDTAYGYLFPENQLKNSPDFINKVNRLRTYQLAKADPSQ